MTAELQAPVAQLGSRQWIQNPYSVGSNPTGGTETVVGTGHCADMHDVRLRADARRLAAGGMSSWQVARELGLPQTTVHRWITQRTPVDAHPPPRCFACDGERPEKAAAAHHAYLLGQYLGDGHLVTRARIPVLRIYACADYPAITDEIAKSIEAVRGRRPGLHGTVNSRRVTKVQSYWNHWPCVLPQHGPGMKHTRPIVLADWQEVLVAEHPWPLIRGLIHSDGCRSINRVTIKGVAYAYPRYFFSNRSRDILEIMGDALDRVGVAWRYNMPWSISIARREAVALLDEHVGPKR
jgi:hypothetical protein